MKYKYKYTIEIESDNDFSVNEVASIIDEGFESECSGVKYRIRSITDKTLRKEGEEK